LYFVVLHEVAHAIRNHLPPNEITHEQNQAQEDEANALAFEWFNSYLATKAQSGVSLFTTAELAEIQKEMQAKMLAALQD
jgi:Zn-dependent peptidase ImmA (M78 family)